MRIPSQINHPHAATAQRANDFVAANLRTGRGVEINLHTLGERNKVMVLRVIERGLLEHAHQVQALETIVEVLLGVLQGRPREPAVHEGNDLIFVQAGHMRLGNGSIEGIPASMSSNPETMAAAFADASGTHLQDEGDRERLAAALSHALLEARDRYQTVQVEGDDFARFLGERMQDSDGDAAAVSSRATSDLYLACACVAGDTSALAALDKHVLGNLPAAMARLKLGSAAIDEAVQRARTKLLVGREGRGKIVDFSGTGDLRGWVKVIAIRDALRTARKEKREVSLSDELSAALPASELDPDLAYQKRLYQAEFKSSFEAAVDELSARERSLLRQSIVYHSTVDQVATIYQVHRATAARWIAKAREQLGNKTRAHLRNRLSLSEDQFESIVRLIESQMDLSMERLLATASDDERVHTPGEDDDDK